MWNFIIRFMRHRSQPVPAFAVLQASRRQNGENARPRGKSPGKAPPNCPTEARMRRMPPLRRPILRPGFNNNKTVQDSRPGNCPGADAGAPCDSWQADRPPGRKLSSGNLPGPHPPWRNKAGPACTCPWDFP